MVGEYSAHDRDRILVGLDLDAQRRRQRRRDEFGIVDPGKINEKRAPLMARLSDEVDGEAGFADPAHTGEGDQPL